MNRRDAFKAYQRSMLLFSRDLVGTPLHPYQVDWADYILDVVAGHRNETVVIEMPRQSGKNETSAQLEVALLARFGGSGGEIVKCAPTWKPQIVNSKNRLDLRSKQVMQKLPFLRIKPSMGYIYKCGRAAISFLSADPNASVVGATASLLMEVDEAQDVDKATYNKKFSPMRASTAAPIVAYGTTWTDDTLLETFKSDVQEGRSAGRYFRVLPETVAESNPAYGEFVDAEVRRLGRDHPFVKTQYFLEALKSAGRMLDAQKLRMMLGSHERQERRTDQAQIVAGLDFAGADEEVSDISSLSDASGRDSVALTVGAVEHVKIAEGVILPHVRTLARYEWVNINPVTLHSALYDILWNRWKVDRVHCDATGIGATGTALLANAINKPGRDRVIAKVFDGALNQSTDLAFGYLAAINGARLVDYKVNFDPIETAGQEATDERDTDRHVWWQRGHAKLDARPNKKVRAYVPDSEGHDDMLNSEMLMVQAAGEVGMPKKASSGQVSFYGN